MMANQDNLGLPYMTPRDVESQLSKKSSFNVKYPKKIHDDDDDMEYGRPLSNNSNASERTVKSPRIMNSVREYKLNREHSESMKGAFGANTNAGYVVSGRRSRIIDNKTIAEETYSINETDDDSDLEKKSNKKVKILEPYFSSTTPSNITISSQKPVKSILKHNEYNRTKTIDAFENYHDYESDTPGFICFACNVESYKKCNNGCNGMARIVSCPVYIWAFIIIPLSILLIVAIIIMVVYRATITSTTTTTTG